MQHSQSTCSTICKARCIAISSARNAVCTNPGTTPASTTRESKGWACEPPCVIAHDASLREGSVGVLHAPSVNKCRGPTQGNSTWWWITGCSDNWHNSLASATKEGGLRAQPWFLLQLGSAAMLVRTESLRPSRQLAKCSQCQSRCSNPSTWPQKDGLKPPTRDLLMQVVWNSVCVCVLGACLNPPAVRRW